MENETLRIRLAKLRQKSRKALGLYRKMVRGSSSVSSALSERQLAEWKTINQELSEGLAESLAESLSKKFTQSVFELRDHFSSRWRDTETLLHKKQKELISASEKGEFARCANLSLELVSLRSREQACKAAYSELHAALAKSKSSIAKLTESPEQIEEEMEEPVLQTANVIPLRRRK